MYKCPYCEVSKDSWKAVQQHTNRCSKSTHEYAIHETIGPLHYTEIATSPLYILHAAYPKAFIKSSIRKFKKYKLLDDTFSFKTKYTNEQIIELLQALYKKLGKTPSVTDYQQEYSYPTSATVINKFGTWNLAIKAAELPIAKIGNVKTKNYSSNSDCDRRIYNLDDVNKAIILAASRSKQGLTKQLFDSYKDLLSSTVVMQFYNTWDEALTANKIQPSRSSLYGQPTLALDNRVYRSKVEAYFVDKYLYNKYNYEVEPKYPNSNWMYDWYIRELDLYIELYGGLRLERLQEKIEVNKDLNRRLLIVTYNDAYCYSSLEEILNNYNI